MIVPVLTRQAGQPHGVLYLKRSPDDDLERERWGVPGGHIDKGETPTIAALRELKEETGIERSPTQLFPLHAFLHVFIESNSKQQMAAEQHVFYTILPPEITLGSVVMCQDHIDKRIDGLPKLRRVAAHPEQHLEEYTGPDIALITKCLSRLEERIYARSGTKFTLKDSPKAEGTSGSTRRKR
jgi:8-oxo-dGTP pyrophosphatase MutT (NUDIX family)